MTRITLKFSNLRPEISTALYTDGETVALPVGSDGYVYTMAELQFLFSMANTGSVPNGDILAENYWVDPGSGLVHVTVQLQDSNNNLITPQARCSTW